MSRKCAIEAIKHKIITSNCPSTAHKKPLKAESSTNYLQFSKICKNKNTVILFKSLAYLEDT